jgi:cyclopropane fatty-acyl-phospholipid synthase-like methyltransferase
MSDPSNMQAAPEQVEEFAGQRILAMDARAEKMLRAACIACGSNEAQLLGVKNELQLLRCRRCDTIYTPYSPWYSSEYYYGSYYPEQSLAPPAFVQTRLEEITAGFYGYRQENRLLDIGCGAGGLLVAARKNGWNAQGLEVAEQATEYVRKLGFEVFHGELQQAEFPSQYFDVITAAEILEHLSEPRGLVQEVARVLRPGGLFWATTPHARGLSARVLGLKWRCVWPPEHLQLFSVAGMKALLREVGFKQIRFQTTGANPIEILHAMGAKKDAPKALDQRFDRVLTNYQLNESLMKNRSRRVVKDVINGMLNVSRLGDSLKVFAIR